MYLKFQNLFESKITNQSTAQLEKFLIAFLTLIFGNENNAKMKVEEINKQFSTQEDKDAEFKKIINFDFFQELFKIAPMNNLSENILSIDNFEKNRELLESKIENIETLTAFLNNDKKITQLFLESIFGYAIDIENKKLLSNQLKYNVYYSKQDIAKEFNIDKKTLNNWVVMIFGKDQYYKRKKISIYEYNDIFQKVFFVKDEGFNNMNPTQIENRLLKGLSYSKIDIVELADSNYQTIDSNLSDINKIYYKKYNKFPYSIAKSMLNDLGSDCKI